MSVDNNIEDLTRKVKEFACSTDLDPAGIADAENEKSILEVIT